MNAQRKTGIALIGDVPWGTHFCQFYQTKDDLLDILVPYFKAGLEHNEFCMWVTSEPVTVDEATRALTVAVPELDTYLEKGQIEILGYSEWYTNTKSGMFDVDAIVQGGIEKEKQALKNGFDGLRLTGNTFWLEKEEWETFTEYEATIDRVIGNYRMLVLCSYSLDKCGAGEVIDVVKNHEFALIRRAGAWEELIGSAERKRVEVALRESEEIYCSLVERANDGITIIQDGIVKYLNQRLAEMRGGAVEDVLGTPFDNYIHPDELSVVRERYERRMAGEKVPALYETALMRKDGSKVFAELSSSIITYQSKPASLVIVRDITEQAVAEAELEKLRANYFNVVNNSADGIVVTRKDGFIRFVNPAAEAIFGRTTAELTGELFGFPLTVGKSTEIDLIRRGGETGTGEMCVAETEWGSETAYLIVIHDITARKRADEERERTFKELEEKNAEMERFVYTVSHELRTPLVTVQGFTGMLREDLAQNKGEQVETDVRVIENTVATMGTLLSETLELSRIGRVVNPPEEVSFGDIVQDALKLVAEQITSSKVDVSVAEDFPTVNVDQRRVGEVLTNLIENSTRYMGDQTQPKIEIGYRLDGEETVFFVQDNGVGIDKSQHEKVFELFYTVDKSGSGTGAGLAVVKRIIEVHGEQIWLESEKDKGCTVCFTLPVVS